MDDRKGKWLSSNGKILKPETTSKKMDASDSRPIYEGNFLESQARFTGLGLRTDADKKNEAKRKFLFDNTPPPLSTKPDILSQRQVGSSGVGGPVRGASLWGSTGQMGSTQYASQRKTSSLSVGGMPGVLPKNMGSLSGNIKKETSKLFESVKINSTKEQGINSTKSNTTTSSAKTTLMFDNRTPPLSAKPVILSQRQVGSSGVGAPVRGASPWGSTGQMGRTQYTTQRKLSSPSSVGGLTGALSKDRGLSSGNIRKETQRSFQSEKIINTKEQGINFTKPNTTERFPKIDPKFDGRVTVKTKTIEQSSSTSSSTYKVTKSSEIITSSVRTQAQVNKEVQEYKEKAKRVLGTTEEQLKEWNNRVMPTEGAISDPRRFSRQRSFKETIAKLSSVLPSKKTTPAGDFSKTDVPGDGEEYPMRQTRLALIFNHNVFDKLAERPSVPGELTELKQRLKDVGFKVEVWPNFRLDQLEAKVKEAAGRAGVDCLLVLVLTVRYLGQLSARDQTYDQEYIFKMLTGDKCSTLVGKPKIFFIDACQGELKAAAKSRVATDATDSVRFSPYTIPIEADILTVTWFYPKQVQRQGSWFVRALCEELNTRGGSRDLLTLLTFVNLRIIRLSSASAFPTEDEVPTLTSMLTQKLYFRKRKVQ